MGNIRISDGLGHVGEPSTLSIGNCELCQEGSWLPESKAKLSCSIYNVLDKTTGTLRIRLYLGTDKHSLENLSLWGGCVIGNLKADEGIREINLAIKREQDPSTGWYWPVAVLSELQSTGKWVRIDHESIGRVRVCWKNQAEKEEDEKGKRHRHEGWHGGAILQANQH